MSIGQDEITAFRLLILYNICRISPLIRDTMISWHHLFLYLKTKVGQFSATVPYSLFLFGRFCQALPTPTRGRATTGRAPTAAPRKQRRATPSLEENKARENSQPVKITRILSTLRLCVRCKPKNIRKSQFTLKTSFACTSL